MTPTRPAAAIRRLKAILPYVVVLTVGFFLYWVASRFEFEQAAGRIGPGAWPKMILLLMGVTALWGIIANAVRAGDATSEAEPEAGEELARPPEIYPAMIWLAVTATVAYLFLLPILGFFLSTLIYSAALMYVGHYRRPLVVAAISLAIALAFMFVFMRVVYVALPLGIAPFNAVSYGLMAAMGVH